MKVWIATITFAVAATVANAQTSANRMGSPIRPGLRRWHRAVWRKWNSVSWRKAKRRALPSKQFGQRMIDDHTKANEELTRIAADEGVTLPTGLDAKDQATKDRLSSLSGKEFDSAYMADMVKDHRGDVCRVQEKKRALERIPK